jgi:hypothetical protein
MEWLNLVSGWLNVVVFGGLVVLVYRRKLSSGLKQEMGARQRELFELQLTASRLEDTVRAMIIDSRLQVRQGDLLLGKIQFWQKAFDESVVADQLALSRIQDQINQLNNLKKNNLVANQQKKLLANLVLARVGEQLQAQYASLPAATSYLAQVCLDVKRKVT